MKNSAIGHGMTNLWRHPVVFIRSLFLLPCKTCIHHYRVWGYGTGFCGCKEYRDRYELERTFCSEIRGTRDCKYFATSRRRRRMTNDY